MKRLALNVAALAATGVIPMSVFASIQKGDITNRDVEVARTALAGVGVDVSKVSDQQIVELLNSDKANLTSPDEARGQYNERMKLAMPCQDYEGGKP